MKFTVPTKNTLIALSMGEKLNKSQVVEILDYIQHNYLLKESDEIAISFYAGEILMVGDSKEDVEARIGVAIKRLEKSLIDGDGIIPIEAIWLADKVYIDGKMNKRIISKCEPDLGVKFDVISSVHNPFVAEIVEGLRRELRVTKWDRVEYQIHTL